MKMRPIIIQEIYNPDNIRKIRLPNYYSHFNSSNNSRANTIIYVIKSILKKANKKDESELKNFYLRALDYLFSTTNETKKSLSLKSDSLNSVDSGHISSPTASWSSSKSNELKKLIMAEKILPYQLKIENSTRDLSLNLNISSNSSTSCYSSFNTDLEPDLTELNEDDLEFLTANTGFTEEQIKRWHLEFLKKCSNCFISFEQFKHYYCTLLPCYLNEKSKEELMSKIFRLFDIDNDGSLNFSEFLVSFWVRCRAPIEEKFTWIFNMIDLDRNGYLSFTELRNALNLCLNLDDLDLLLEQLNRDRTMGFELSTDSDSDDSDFEEEILQKNKKYNLYSRTSRLVEDKLNETVILLDLVSRNENNRKSTCIFDTASSMSSFTSISRSNSIDSFNLEENKQIFYKKIQITRASFLFLCKKYRLLRKLILPIKYFYEEDFLSF